MESIPLTLCTFVSCLAMDPLMRKKRAALNPASEKMRAVGTIIYYHP